MSFSHSALPQTSRPWRSLAPGATLAGLLLTGSLSAQAGSVEFSIQSFEPVSADALASYTYTDAATDAEFPLFGTLHAMPFDTLNSARIDLLVLQRFKSLSEIDPYNTDDARIKIIAEYDAYDSRSDVVRESGLLAFEMAENQLASASGDNIVGFIRQTQVPSMLTRETKSGYLDGLEGTIYWDFDWASRRGYSIASGAAYAPDIIHENYLSITTTATTAAFSSFEIPVAGTYQWVWDCSTSGIRALRNLSGLTPYLFYGIVERTDGILAEDLLSLGTSPVNYETVISNQGEPWEFQNKIYVIRLNDLNDTDRDRVPDFMDLTDTLTEMPIYADLDNGDNWYYSYMMKDWVYSDPSSDWDYTLKSGWIYPYPESTREYFWYYASGGDPGWYFTSDRWFPWIYRNRDNSFLYWLSTAGTTSEYYNYTHGDTESISF